MSYNYYRSIADEIYALLSKLDRLFSPKSPPKSLCGYYGSAIRKTLKKHVPPSIVVGYGQVAHNQAATHPLDVILYNADAPLLYKEGDYIIISPEYVIGGLSILPKIEDRFHLIRNIGNLTQTANVVKRSTFSRSDSSEEPEESSSIDSRFFGLWTFETEQVSPQAVLVELQKPGNDNLTPSIDFLNLGSNACYHLQHDHLSTVPPKWKALTSRDLQEKIQGQSSKDRLGIVYGISALFKAISEDEFSYKGISAEITNQLNPNEIERIPASIESHAAVNIPVKDSIPFQTKNTSQHEVSLDKVSMLTQVSDDAGLGLTLQKTNDLKIPIKDSPRVEIENRHSDVLESAKIGIPQKLVPTESRVPKKSLSSRLAKRAAKKSRKKIIPNPKDLEGNSAVHTAVLSGNYLTVEKQLNKDDSMVLSKNKDGNTPLHLAAIYGLSEILELLIPYYPQINIRNYFYATSLHLAVANNHEDIVTILIEAGAELEARNNRSHTALHQAAVHGTIGCAEILIEAGADIHASMEKDIQPLHLAAWYGHGDLVQFLIARGVEINGVNVDGNTALHFAAFNGQVKVIKILIKHHADLSHTNHEGDTYLQGINEGYRGEMIRVLD